MSVPPPEPPAEEGLASAPRSRPPGAAGALVLGIDASNIRAGGGLTHLACLLAQADPAESGIGRVIVWGGRHTLDALPGREWLERAHEPALDGSLPARVFWQSARLPRRLAERRCDALLSPGGIAPRGAPCPTFVISQNLLPFEPREIARYGPALHKKLRLHLVRHAQVRSMAHATGIVFLTEYARDTVLAALPGSPPHVAVIPHGVEDRFFREPRPAAASGARFRVLYVSGINFYKHQVEVCRAARLLRDEGIPVEVDFVGPAYYSGAMTALRREVARLDPGGEFLRLRGEIPFSEVDAAYREADAFVFASSCENLPNILIEAMASGLPVASSDRGPMPEVLGSAGLYFDPEDPASIAAALRRLHADGALRERLAREGLARARGFSWGRCARDTLSFIASTVCARRAAGAA